MPIPLGSCGVWNKSGKMARVLKIRRSGIFMIAKGFSLLTWTGGPQLKRPNIFYLLKSADTYRFWGIKSQFRY